jgi:hypothetical protein
MIRSRFARVPVPVNAGTAWSLITCGAVVVAVILLDFVVFTRVLHADVLIVSTGVLIGGVAFLPRLAGSPWRARLRWTSLLGLALLIPKIFHLA